MKILLIEDDKQAARLLCAGLREEGFTVDVAHSAEDATQPALLHDYDLIVLDWMLPGQDGLAWCRDLRARGRHLPVLMLTARDALDDRVNGLEGGADDYLTKPYAFEELLARARALTRRAGLAQPRALTVADLRLDPLGQQVARNGQPLNLTRKEYAVLELLMRQAGDIVSRAALAEQVWRADLIGVDNLIDVHLANLRRKVDPPGLPPLIHTVRGQGFCVGPQRVAGGTSAALPGT